MHPYSDTSLYLNLIRSWKRNQLAIRFRTQTFRTLLLELGANFKDQAPQRSHIDGIFLRDLDVIMLVPQGSVDMLGNEE